MATLFAAGATTAGTSAATAAAASGAAAGGAAAGGAAAGMTAATAAGYALTATSVLSMVRGGEAAKVGSKVQADRIKQDAVNREVNRRRRLVSSLASQNAARAASGVAFFEGSSKEAALEDIRTGRGGMLVERAGSQTAAESTLAAGRYSAQTSYIKAGASLLDQINRSAVRG